MPVPGLISGFMDVYSTLAAQRQQAIRDAVDQEMARQRIQDQQASYNETARYHQQLADQANADLAERKRQFDIKQEGGDTTPEERGKQAVTLFNILAQNMDPRLAVSAAEKATPGFTFPENFGLNAAGWSPSTIPAPAGPAEAGPNATQLPASQVGTLNGQAIPTLGTQTQPPALGMLSLPGTEAKIQEREALADQRRANAKFKNEQADRIVRLAQGEQDRLAADTALKQSQTALAQARQNMLTQNFAYKKWWDGQRLAVDKARVEIAQDNVRLRERSLSIQERGQINTNNRVRYQALSTDLGRVETEKRGLESALDKSKSQFDLAAETLRAYDEAGMDKNSKDYQVANSIYQARLSELPKMRQRIKELESTAGEYRKLMDLTGTVKPVDNSGSLMPSNSLAPLSNRIKVGPPNNKPLMPTMPKAGSFTPPKGSKIMTLDEFLKGK